MDKKSSLTSFNFNPLIENQQDDEGVLSKIFVKVKSAVSGQSDTSSKAQSIVSIPHTVSTTSLETTATSESATIKAPQKEPSMINFPASLHAEAAPRAPTTATTTTTVTVGNSKANHDRMQSNNSSSVHFAIPANAGSSEEYAPEYFLNSPLTKEMSMDSDNQSVVTNFSISNSNSLSKILARLRGQKNDKEFWMPDEQCKECYKCRKPFTLLRRKHHCRTCGQIFCAKCASHVVSGKMYKQKGQVRVCNFCYAEQQHKEEEENISLPYKQEISYPLSKKQTTDSYSPIIPSQKPPRAVPKMQIPTTAFKQTRSTYGSEDTTTFALEIPAHSNSYQSSSPLAANDVQIPILANCSQNDRPPNALDSYSTVNHLPAITATSTEGGFKRLLDAGTSLLKSRPRSNTSNSAPLEDTRHSVTPYESPAPFRGGMYSPNHSGYLDKGGGTVVTESDLSGYQGNNVEADMNGDLEYQPYERPPNLVGLNSSVRMSSNSSHRSADELIEEVMGSDDDSYENRLRIKWSDERKGRERTISFPRRKSLNNGSPRMRSIRINTSGLPKSDFGQEGRSPHLSPYIGDDKFSFGQDITKSSRFRPPRQRRISGPPQTVELSITALSHARKMLRQLMEEINLSDSNTSKEDWEDVIMNILLKVTNNVQPDVRSGDDMDVRHYVKIKKIPGGLPSDSFYVKGVVCTKNMVHKRMVKNISHPRILILLFSLDYSRVEMENQLLSIAPVISQEREHISKLVGRIVALKPSLLLVKSNVSRLALEFLLAANIPVIHNVKHSVIEAIARCTQATVVTSVDKLQQGVSFGRCGSFEVRTIIHEWLPNRRKTFLIFDDCAPELGGTIVLRGAKDDTLSVIKRLIDFMVFVVNNLKLETSILRDSFAKNRGSLEEAEEHPTDVDEDGMNVSGHHLMDLIKLYQTTILSVSQYVVFPSPYLLLTLKEVEDKLMLLQQNHCKSISSVKDVPLSASPTRSTFERQSISSEVPSHSTEEGIDAEYDLMAKHHQITRAWDAYIGENPESISPFFHQNIVVLYSSVCTVTTVPCRGPEIRIFSFYRFPSDKTLGQYIMDLCVDAHQPCTSMMCDHPMLQHYRSYAHGDARINVMIESFDCPLPGMSDKLLMWSYCRECNKPTPVLPMSENTWNYSFGKFLEIFLYQKGVHCRADICPHDMVRHHVRYFGYMNLAVRFQYDSIELLEVSPPPMRLFILSKVQMDLKEEELRTLRQKINKFYQSIAERNKSFPFDLVDPRKLETCKVELQEMSLEAQGEKKDALQLVQNIYANSDQNDTLSMTWVRRRLFQLVERWDAVYSDFVRYYLQPERELKKLTASHLRKMFPADFSDGVILSLDNERIKRATEVGDLPLLGVSLDGETNDTLVDRADKKGKDISSGPAVLPILSISPSDKSLNDLALSSDTTCSSYKENKLTFLRPEVRRRFSLDLMNELNEKLKSEENNDSSSSNRRNLTKFMRVKGSATPPAAYTPSRIPVPLISNQKGPGTPMCDLYRPPHLSTSESPRNTIKNESKILSPQPGYRRHRRHNSIGHTQDLGQSIFDEIKNSINRSELSSSYLGHGSGSRDNRFRSKLPRKKTYMQVYTRANELVQEDMEDEFHPYHSPESKKKNKRHHIPIQKSKNHRHLSYPDRMLPFYDDGEDADCDSNNEGQDDSEPEVDYFSPMAPFARNVIETNTVPLEVSIDSNPESSQGSFSRPYFPFSDGQQDMSGEDDTDRDLPCASDLLKAQQLDDMSISDLHNIHPDMISSNPNTMSINLSLSDTLYESRHSPEKSSFMKTLTNFLPDSGVRNLLPLELPLLPTEHIFPDSCVVVREDEPSTIIAYTLSSEDYIEKMHDIQEYGSGSNSDTVKAERRAPSEVTAIDSTVQTPAPPTDIQETLLRESGTHMRYNFSTGSTKFFCKIFFSEQFDALRRNCGCSESYIMSLAKCIKWDVSGGKSGSAFVKTKDDRLLMKQMSKYELDAFLGFAPYYFQYMSEAFFSELPTVLAKIFGFYSIGYKNSATGKSMRMDVLVMENLFYQRNVKKIFDLKGSMRNRHVQSTGKQDEVLLDENLVELIYQSPLFIRGHSKEILRSSLHNDTLFLCNSNIMDYSLLVGIDEQRQELVVGIVDFIRTFTWDKKLESWVKESGILGGGGKEPTIVSPRQYRIRFREAMERYFLMVPDCWVLNRQNSTLYSALHHHPSISDEEY